MDVVIREDIAGYMADLKKFLADTRNESPEEMAAFFSARLDIYEEHMSAWAKGYRRLASLLPERTASILDLGCGTGLELDEIFRRFPDVEVTGIDLCADMLKKLSEKHPDKNLTLLCADYLAAPFGENSFDAAVSFESLHHFFPGDKLGMYRKLSAALKETGVFILGDYIACCDEEEELLREAYLEKRRRFPVSGKFVHFDIPLTAEHEISLLKDAGFAEAEIVGCENGATLIAAKKSRV